MGKSLTIFCLSFLTAFNIFLFATPEQVHACSCAESPAVEDDLERKGPAGFASLEQAGDPYAGYTDLFIKSAISIAAIVAGVVIVITILKRRRS